MSDQSLIAMAQAEVMKALVSGAKTIELPAAVFNRASKQTQDQVRTACNTAGVQLRLK